MPYLWKSHLAGVSGDLDPIYHQKARSEILPYIDWEPRRILDIGCGGGATGRLLQEHFPNCELYGIELHSDAATFASKTYRHIAIGNIESADFSTKGIPLAEIDTVLLLDVLEHLYNPWLVLEKLRHQLPPHCRIVASIPNAFNVQLLEELASGQWKYDRWGLLDITHIRFFTEPEMRELFEQTGFAVIRIGNIPHPESMPPPHLQMYGDRIESEHMIVKAVDANARNDLMTIQKVFVATCDPTSIGLDPLPDNRPIRFAAPILNPVLGKPYLDLVRNCILGFIYEDPAMVPTQGVTSQFSADIRENGLDWPSVSHSMIGNKRMRNVQHLAEHVLTQGIPGDFIETGVWRGGTCIMMRAVLKAYDVTDRTVWVADSFEGLPPPNPERYPADTGDTHFKYEELAVSIDQVKRNFDRYGLLDGQVNFLKGWFCDTLPTAPIEKLALLRLDGDMYESTIDALKNLFPKLSPGGFVIIDDYGYIESCRQAVHDYRNENGIIDTIYDIDGIGVFWQNLLPNRFSPNSTNNAHLTFNHHSPPLQREPPPPVEPNSNSVEDTKQAPPPLHPEPVENPIDSEVDESPLAQHHALVKEAARLCSIGDLPNAADILIGLVMDNTQVWEAYNDLAAISIHQGDVETAEQLLQKAIEKSIFPGKANLNLAILQVVNRQFETALETLSPLLRHDPGNFATLELIREILEKTNSISPVAWARLTSDLRSQPGQ